MEDNSLAVIFSGNAKHRSADQDYQFTPSRNFYYLTSIDRQDFVLLITKYNGKVDETLFILKSNPDIEKWIGYRMKAEAAKTISGINKIAYAEDFEATFNRLLDVCNFKNIYLDTHYRVEGFLSKALDLTSLITKNFPYLKILSASQLINDFRTLKETEEIEAMRKAIDITKVGIENIMKNAKPGLMEYQLEAYYDFAIKFNGANGPSFKTIAASGLNGTVLHYEENNCIAEDHTLVLFDLGCEYEYYCSDISRTIPVNGKFTDRQKAVYESVLSVNEKMIEWIKPGKKFKEFQETAREMLAEECIKLGLMTDKKDISKYYYHGIGHYLGLDVHDVGRTDMNERVLEPGMVLTVEPGLYIAEEKIGVRIEDNIIVTVDGCENLSKDIIKSVSDIESFMKK
jgi:Xaa-Pro aminopeptidase